MKVLLFMTQFHRLNGAERLAVELAEELNKRGIHADILSMYAESGLDVEDAQQNLLRRGIPAVHFLGLSPHPPFRSLITAVRKLRRLIKDHRYDIVETSQVSPTVIAAWATANGCASHVAGLHHVYRKQSSNSPQHRFWRFTVRWVKETQFYAISDYVAQSWIEYSRTAPARTRTIHNAIPDDCFTAVPDKQEVCRELGIPDKARLALYTGRISAIKGIDTLVDALGPVLETQNLFVLCVGEPDYSVKGTREMIRYVDERLAREPWGARFRFLGFRKDVPRLMASADVLVHPSRTEGFGLVLAEAMAAGLPVVASNVEGIPEVLAGTASLMTPPDDPHALRDAVLATLNRPLDEAARAVAMGRRHTECFRIGERIDSMIRLFEEVQRERC